jgi:hypothetical protein
MTPVRTLPLRVAPLPGEAIDSWLEAIGYRCGTPWAQFRVALGAVLPGSGYRDQWILRLTDEQVTAISAATEIDADAVRSMTLAGYPSMAVGVDSRTGRSVSSFPWRHIHASRFCPYCLAENGGRWKLVWRMVWFFICETHRCLLADACPECGGAQRRRSLSNLVPQPDRCAAIVDEAATPASSRCGADLTQARVTRLDLGHAALAAQAAVADAIITGTVDFGIYRGFPHLVPQMLADIRALGQYFLSDADPQILDALVPPDLLSEYGELQRFPRTFGRRAPDRASPAVSTAVAVTAAMGILGQTGIPSAAEVMRSIWPHGENQPLFSRITKPVAAGAQVSTALLGVHLTALGPQLGVSDQLRCRLGTALPRRAIPDLDSAALMATRIPTLFWPEWSLRLAGSQSTQRTLRPALSVAVLLVGAELKVRQAIGLLDCPLSVQAVTTVLRQLKASRHWQGIRWALYRLSDWLRRFGAPIDYQRRRHLVYTGLLPQRKWKGICRSTHSRPEGVATARKFLFERLSATYAFAAPVAATDATAYASFLRFPTRLTPELNSAMSCYARDFLAAHGITGEPTEWAPPVDLLHGLDLPSAGTANLDATEMHRLIRGDGLSEGAVADRLKTSIDVVRLALEQHPAPRAPRPPPQRRQTVAQVGPAYQKASALLTWERFAQLYETEGRSLKDIASRLGVSRATVAELGRDYGIRVRRSGGRRKSVIDPDWLYDQYVNKGRSLADLAREVGICCTSLAEWARICGVPVRALSRHSLTTLKANTKIPKVLVPALATQGGWERLQRLPRIAECASLAATASQFNTSGCVLGSQIAALERDLGGTILIRTSSQQPQNLTPLGKRVIAAVNDLVALGGP